MPAYLLAQAVLALIRIQKTACFNHGTGFQEIHFDHWLRICRVLEVLVKQQTSFFALLPLLYDWLVLRPAPCPTLIV